MLPPTLLSGERGRATAGEQLRHAIRSGELLPAERLVEQELAGRFGVTRSAVRAALMDLTAEGLVERIPNKGSRVRVVTLEEAIAITEVRLELEGLCAAKAAENATGADCADLRALGQEMVAAVETSNALRYGQLNKDLHEKLRILSGQPVAQDLLLKLNGQLVRERFRLSTRPDRPSVSVHEHLAIIEGVCAGDAETAREAMRRHLHSVIGAMRETKGRRLPA
ncbi:MAG TPA: GntR family transcriptional regulator [Propionibacterium sp.]|nr:GntR family transcriptional regulator [Propionibacterium sp.]